jgi:ornithine cyclodeaminase/alanine dehydrogenase-like protein (mu-crystallin family)
VDFKNPFHVFSADDVRTALPMREAIPAIREAFRELATGQVIVPLRTHLEIERHDADVLVMSCYSSRLDQVGMKLITLHPGNVERGLPYIQATVMLLDAERGTPLAVMSGAALTAIRTGAASGVATDALARPDASRVAIIGTGVQAATQLEAMCTVRDIVMAKVFDLDQARASLFAQNMQKRLEIEVTPAASAADALSDADIICTATTAKKPVFDDADVKPGAHINAIGVYKPDQREIPGATVARARVVVDDIEATWEEAGDLILPLKEGLIDKSHIHAALGDIVTVRKGGREAASEITFFKSVGVGNQDLSAAHVVLARGTALDLGTVVAL